MKELLFVKKLHLPVFSSTKPDFAYDEEREFEHLQVCCLIRQYVDDDVYNHIANETLAKNLWEKIESLYASKSRNNKLFLLNCFISLKYKEDTSISYHLSEFQGLMDHISGMAIKFEDELLGLFLLLSLPESWEICFEFPLQVLLLKVLFLCNRLRVAQGTSSQSEVHVTENTGKSKKKKTRKVVKRIEEASPKSNARIWSVIIVIN
jgi:hypothetical protein